MQICQINELYFSRYPLKSLSCFMLLICFTCVFTSMPIIANIISLNSQFSFEHCKFKVQKSKEGTGRVVMWQMGIMNSYTMEVSKQMTYHCGLYVTEIIGVVEIIRYGIWFLCQSYVSLPEMMQWTIK